MAQVININTGKAYEVKANVAKNLLNHPIYSKKFTTGETPNIAAAPEGVKAAAEKAANKKVK